MPVGEAPKVIATEAGEYPARLRSSVVQFELVASRTAEGSILHEYALPGGLPIRLPQGRVKSVGVFGGSASQCVRANEAETLERSPKLVRGSALLQARCLRVAGRLGALCRKEQCLSGPLQLGAPPLSSLLLSLDSSPAVRITASQPLCQQRANGRDQGSPQGAENRDCCAVHAGHSRRDVGDSA